MAMALLLTTDEEAKYYQSCCLFGDPSAMQNEWTNDVSGNPNNVEVKIKPHEKTQAHLYLIRSSPSGDGRRATY